MSSRDGKYVATGRCYRSVAIFNAETGKCEMDIKHAHFSMVTSILLKN